MTLLLPAVFSFIATFVLVLFVKSYMLESGVVAIDHNKKGKPILPSGCGIAASMGFTIGILVYAFGSSFNVYTPVADLVTLFALSLSVVLVSLVGLIDDINVKGSLVKTTDMSDTRKGMKQWQKPVMTLLGAIPLIAINAGHSTVMLPFVGVINLGIVYPLIVIPLAVIFTSNSFNLLGGFDGLATGTGLIAAIALLLYSVFLGTYTGALISGVLVSTLLVFVIFNIYPSKLIPGDSFTYFVGTALVADMIIGNMEAFGLIVFAPWIIEFILHAMRKFKVTDLGKPRADMTMEPPYGKKVYSWTHLIMNLKRCKEWEVSLYMWFVEIVFVVLAFAVVLLR
jgi:UDP-N-acetylglucosamine--dolichyl-phosphate N-acetylglucosaminephosphotransferase